MAKPDVIVHARNEESVKKKINKKVALKCTFYKYAKIQNYKLKTFLTKVASMDKGVSSVMHYHII